MNARQTIWLRTLLPLLLGAAVSNLPLHASPSDADAPPSPATSASRLAAHVAFLASDDLRGRSGGSRDEALAALYIESLFRQYGLSPPGDLASHQQVFPIGLRRLGPGNHLASQGTDGESVTFKRGWDYLPHPLSPSTSIQRAPLVLAGYGIHAPDLDYDDYKSIDVQGKIVLVLRHEPREDNETSPFEGLAWSAHARILEKARVAKERGAAALLIVQDPLHHTSSIPPGGPFWPSTLAGARGEEPDRDLAESIFPGLNLSAQDLLDALARAAQASLPETLAPLPIAFVSARFPMALLEPLGIHLADLQKAIDRRLRPWSIEIPRVTIDLSVDIRRDDTASRNVVGYLEGRDPVLRKEVVVLGAHFDHIGSDQDGQVWNGADDNASGTAVLLEVARAFASERIRPRRSLLFIAFGSEEMGLLGSRHYVEHPLLPLQDTVAMLNADMVGRGVPGNVTVMGASTSDVIEDLIEGYDEECGLLIQFNKAAEEEFFGRSDHASFYRKQIPVAFFSTLLHDDYHRPSDTADKLRYENMAQIAGLLERTARDIADLEERPIFADFEIPAAVSATLGSTETVFPEY